MAPIPFISPQEIIKEGISTIRKVQKEIEILVKTDPGTAFETALLGTRRKRIIVVDKTAEIKCQVIFGHRKYRNQIEVIGEEKLRNPNLDLSDRQCVVALVDMVDGSDLLKSGLPIWCSALIFYYPPEQIILGAFVGIPGDGIYYATEGTIACKQPFDNSTPIPLNGPSKVQKVEEATICFYGQKIKNLLSLVNSKKLIKKLTGMSKRELKSGQELRTRMFNMAGNPMMVRLANGIVDAVIELKGQSPHDMVPGAYIAMKAGAFLTDLNNKPIDLFKALLRPADPKSRLKYILASTEPLKNEILSYLSK